MRELRPLLGPLVQEDVKGKSKGGEVKDKSGGKKKKAKVEGPGKPVNGEIAKVRAEAFSVCDPFVSKVADQKPSCRSSAALCKALQAI